MIRYLLLGGLVLVGFAHTGPAGVVFALVVWIVAEITVRRELSKPRLKFRELLKPETWEPKEPNE